VDTIIHSAAMVNFIYPYENLKKTNVRGMREILRFAFAERPKLLHFVSSAAIWPMGSRWSFGEDSSIDHGVLLNLGYDETKWVQEKMLQAAKACGLPAVVYRPGEVSGDSKTGRFNVGEHFAFALLKGCLQIAAFPPINCWVDLTPVDYVARAIVDLAWMPESLDGVFHITNPHPLHSTQLFAWFRSFGYRFDVLAIDEWLDRLIRDEGFTENALYPYLALLEEFGERNFQLPRYECQRTTRALAASGASCAPVDDRLLTCYTEYFIETGFLPPPEQHRAVAHGKETRP